MEAITLTILIIGVLIWIWITVLGVIAVKYDQTLDSFQRKAQMLIAVIIPVFGAVLVIHLVNQHSPEAIPKSMVPWPLKMLVFGLPHPRNRNRDNNECPAEDLVMTRRQNSAHEFDSSGVGGDADGD